MATTETVVTIEVQVHFGTDDARAAYDRLCDALGKLEDVEWETVCYFVDGGPSRDPEELWPDAN